MGVLDFCGAFRKGGEGLQCAFGERRVSLPDCICACCQEFHWRSQMQKCRVATLSRSPVQALAAYPKPALPVEHGCKAWIFCKSCARHFQQNKVPPRADAGYSMWELTGVRMYELTCGCTSSPRWTLYFEPDPPSHSGASCTLPKALCSASFWAFERCKVCFDHMLINGCATLSAAHARQQHALHPQHALPPQHALRVGEAS